jgi:hypothetical protein
MQSNEWPVGATQYASFLVRFWRASDQGAALSPTAWQGEVEHIQTRGCSTFDSLDELLRLLRRQLEDAHRAKHKV